VTDPFSHPWKGGLFGDAEVAWALGAKAELAAMIAIEAAHARALGSEDAARAIEAAHIDLAMLRAGMAEDGVVVPALVRCLKGQIDPALHEMIHKGLTSQDVIDTAQVLMLRGLNDLLRARINSLAAALAGLRKTYGASALMGRTRMQAALPIKVADRIDTWALPLADHLTRLDEVSPRLLRLSAGGPVGLGLPETHQTHMAEMLGLAVSPKAPHTVRDGIAEYAGWLSLVTGTLGKMGQDVALMAQQGVDEIALAGGGGSSAMPHKQNPVLAELLVTLSRFNAVQVSGMHQAMVHEQERSGAAWSLEWMILPQMTHAAARALSVAVRLAGQIERMGSDAGRV
jgi:3-carboxy-cis,cis-muconate cycloisomerase